MVNKRCI